MFANVLKRVWRPAQKWPSCVAYRAPCCPALSMRRIRARFAKGGIDDVKLHRSDQQAHRSTKPAFDCRICNR